MSGEPTPLSMQLIQAANLLCDYVAKNLPEGWQVDLCMRSCDCELQLIDPEGNDVEFDAFWCKSGIESAVETAKESPP